MKKIISKNKKSNDAAGSFKETSKSAVVVASSSARKTVPVKLDGSVTKPVGVRKTKKESLKPKSPEVLGISDERLEKTKNRRFEEVQVRKNAKIALLRNEKNSRSLGDHKKPRETSETDDSLEDLGEELDIGEEDIENEMKSAGEADQALTLELNTPELDEASDPETVSDLPTSTLLPTLKSSSVTAYEPLRRYLEDLKKYPLLNPEEEFKLVDRLQNSGDMEAAKALVSANLRLVVKIAFEYRTFYSNILDLIQEGNVGLMKAVSKFDPTKGARLGYYASWWIRSYILKYLLDNFRLVKVGTTQAQKKLFYHLMREKERLEAQGLLAGPKLLAEKLNVREKDVIEMEQRLSSRGAELSLDAPLESDSDRAHSHLDFLVDHQEGADETLSKNQLLELLSNKLPAFKSTLRDKELSILNQRLLAEEPKTLQEVADLYGLTRERARQIEAKVIEKLKDFLKDSLT